MPHYLLARLGPPCLSAFICLCALVTQGHPATLPPILMHSGWVTFKNIEDRGGFKIFRRYGYIGDDFKNLIMFNCSRDVKAQGQRFSSSMTACGSPNADIGARHRRARGYR